MTRGEDDFTIKEVSNLLNIPAHTLRFWENEGLFTIKKTENQYRHYTARDLPIIANIIFYRNLGLGIEAIKDLECISVDKYASVVKETQTQLEQKLHFLQTTLEQNRAHVLRVTEIQRLMDTPFVTDDVPFDLIESFEYHEKSKLIRYSQDPSTYVRFYDTQNMASETRGIISDSVTNSEKILWKKQPSKKYISFLIREQVDNEYESDVLTSLEKLQQKYSTGILLAQYIFTTHENGILTDYFKGYLEVSPRK